ncbi:DUF6265 family protein [Sphingosinicella rhizophila]|uniref:DUF6265 family protein n=1 Tax=Sphingosinicella rhizophila TaxID=3050082 RepID=A0ABU3Q768_9SPHN|nr:DUF6265 family protein [Sphingosinicella sp. GR2756]MDT9599244.1 DUF6265 family protein [Sphingosinicella sp. GR2756]
MDYPRRRAPPMAVPIGGMMKLSALLALMLFLAAPPPAAAQAGRDAPAAQTRRAVPGKPPPPARLSDLAWLAGTWEGEGITGRAREIYLPAADGQIAGHFTQMRGDSLFFYEITAIAVVGNSLEYRVRHFNADLTGWEEKDEVVRFPLVAVEEDAWFFDGLTIRRDGPDNLVTAVVIGDKGGSSREAVFRYRRAR